MLRLLAPLVGFALFGALFAGLYYAPSDVEKPIGWPKFRLDPGEVKPDFIEPAAMGENITVNVTVLRGGPIDVYLLDMVNLTLRVLDGTTRGFDIENAQPFYNRTFSAFNVTKYHNFTFVADGENRWGLVVVSRVPPPLDPDNLSAEQRELFVTEVDVDMRYLDSERKSLVVGYIMAIPSLVLVVVAFWARWRNPVGRDDPRTPRGTVTPGTTPLDPRDL